MLTAIGQGVQNLQDYTNLIDKKTQLVTLAQGDQSDKYVFTVYDRTGATTFTNEDDVVALDENDVNGWPTVNLLQNPSFEGTYTSGKPSNWSTYNAPASGVTLAADTSVHYSGATSWKTAFANTPTTGEWLLIQQFALPFDQNGNPLVALPYCASVWYLASGLSGVTATVGIEWWNANFGSLLRTDKSSAFSGTTSSWQRASVVATPPVGAAGVKFTVRFNVTSTTNAGTVWADGAQLEYCTFGNYRSQAFPPPLVNPTMGSQYASATTPDGWLADLNGLADTTISLITSGALHAQAAQIALAASGADTSYTRAIQPQAPNSVFVNPNMTYTLAMKYRVTAALNGNSRARIGVNWRTASEGYLSTSLVEGPHNEVVSQPNQWNTLSIALGAGTANPAPAGGAAKVKAFAGILPGSSGSSGTIVVGEITLTPTMAQGPGAEQTALAAGMYPTPYCDNNQPGCHTDTGGSGLYYRQLRLFGGYVRTAEYDYTAVGGPESSVVITANDYGVTIAEAPANYWMPYQTDTACLQQIFSYAQNQGHCVGIDFTTYAQHIASFGGYLFNWTDARNPLNKLANALAAAYWVDPYKYLHFLPALAASAPYNLSATPDYQATFPFSKFKLKKDSSQALTTPVIEGSTQLSAPQTQTFTGLATTLSGSGVVIATGAAFASIGVAAIAQAVPVGTILQIGNGTSTMTFVVAATANTGATSISVTTSLFNGGNPVANDNYSGGNNVTTMGVQVNTGAPIVQIDQLTVGSQGQLVVGLFNSNTYSQGYGALYDPPTGNVYFQTACNNAGTITVVYRINSPVLIKLHTPSAEAPTGSIRRKIHVHIKVDEIATQQGAIDRGNSEISQHSKKQNIGEVTIMCPPWPLGAPPRPGTAIAITYPPAGLQGTLFQIQQVTIRPSTVGPVAYAGQVFGGGIGPGHTYVLTLGYYQPDFRIQAAQLIRDLAWQSTAVSPQQELQDVVAASDGWAMGDSASASVSNIGKWQPSGAATSTWDGTGYVWG